MKISDVKTFLVHPGIAKNLCFVKIETDSEIFGWGECYTQTDRDTQIVSHIEQTLFNWKGSQKHQTLHAIIF